MFLFFFFKNFGWQKSWGVCTVELVGIFLLGGGLKPLGVCGPPLPPSLSLAGQDGMASRALLLLFLAVVAAPSPGLRTAGPGPPDAPPPRRPRRAFPTRAALPPPPSLPLPGQTKN